MLVAVIHIMFELPEVCGLKERRKYLNSIKERLKKFNVSVLDISKEYPKEGELALSFLALSEVDVQKKVQSIEEMLQKRYPEIVYEFDIELL